MARPKNKKRAAKTVKRKRFLFFPYPLIVFILICSGVYLVAWTFNAHADDLVVNAIVKDKPITSPAVITDPSEGEHFKAVPIEVNGTCPDHGAYVEIFSNGIMRGSSICDNKSFGLQIDLFSGANKLEAHVFNITDDEGPISAPVNVTYDVPPPQPNLQPATPSANKLSPLLLQTAFIYKGYYTGQVVEWPLDISGGAEPYALNVDWGDGQNSIISRPHAGQFNITHTYTKPPGNKLGDYTVKVQASDSIGNYSYLQFFVIVNQRSLAGSPGPTTNIFSKGPPTLGGLHQWVWAVWPVYLSVVLMAVSFRLGEREELILLRKRHQLRRS